MPLFAQRFLSSLPARCLDLLFPPRCPGCGLRLTEAHALCMTCLAELDPPAPVSSCSICALPFAPGTFMPGSLAPVCGACAVQRPAYRMAAAASSYGPLSRRMVTDLKFCGRSDLVPVMAKRMRAAARSLAEDHDLIVPAPLHLTRLRQRGYNQAALLAEEVARLTDLPCDPHALRRIKLTVPQLGLSAKARRTNLAGALEGDAARLQGKRILLVDDVATTGATAEACAKAALRAGALSVDLLTFAKAGLHPPGKP